MQDWFVINNIHSIDSPALVFYKEKIDSNIQQAISMIDDINLLRPHVKTNKTDAVCRMMMDAGITKFKCATIAEAEMLGRIEAPDVLLAYQPVGPKALRFLQLVKKYTKTKYSCLVDDVTVAEYLSSIFQTENRVAEVFIDVNTGNNRTGILPSNALDLFQHIIMMPAIKVIGLHAYDGHIHDTDLALRQQKSDTAFKPVKPLAAAIEAIAGYTLIIVAGGTPTYPTHTKRNVECSPGTFVFWDYGYNTAFPDMHFNYAALLITRVISLVNETTITTDLGHKSVAAENPLPRVYFLNAEATPESQSEEHLVLSVTNSSNFKVGDVLYGVPHHICPTVALYDEAFLVENNTIVDVLNVIARKKRLSI